MFVSLHTADPTGGDQTTHEAAFPGYARAPANPGGNTDFPESRGGAGEARFFAVGEAADGPGRLLAVGRIVPAPFTAAGITVRLRPGTYTLD